jgi:hypothetical protein
MQTLARQQWFKRARELGMVPEDASPSQDDEDDDEAVVQYGITGGNAPSGSSPESS